MAELDKIRNIITQNGLGYSHYALARFINETFPGSTELDLWLLILVNLEITRGNVCLDISNLKDHSQVQGWDLDWPEITGGKEVAAFLNNSEVIGSAEDTKPLVYDQQKLYLNRYFHQEKNIARTLLSMAENTTDLDTQSIESINNLFPQDEEIDYQKLAAIVSRINQLCIISGGPGTGKTWTVSKILALLLAQQPGLKIQLAAPTGKAAARLSESIMALVTRLPLEDSIRQLIPHQAQTLHRLLGIHRFTHRPRFNQKQKLDCDVLVLDEASMIDQTMMALVCAALPEHCKLILLGDKDQLSSVEAGSVFADLCGGLDTSQFSQKQQSSCRQHWNIEIPLYGGDFVLADEVVVLHKSHRFDDRSLIGRLARSIKHGDPESSIELLKQAADSSELELSWSQPGETEISQRLTQQAGQYALKMMQAETINEAFGLFHQHQIIGCLGWPVRC